MEEFTKLNDLNMDRINEITLGCVLSGVLEQLVANIDEKKSYITFKKNLQDCFTEDDELSIIRNEIKKFTQVKLAKFHEKQILEYLKAHLNKLSYRVKIQDTSKSKILCDQNNVCAYCNSKLTIDNTHYDHIIAFKFVGDELENNYQALCTRCNLEKSTNSFYPLKNYLLKLNSR